MTFRSPAALFAPSYNFTRPTNTSAYAAGDLVANNTAAASVVPMSWSPSPQRAGFYVTGVRLHKTTVTVTAAQFRVHLYKATPTFTSSGDNGVFATVVATGNADWIGSFDGTILAAHADGSSVICVPTEGAIIPQAISAGTTIYGLIEALAAYAPGNAEVFTAELLVEQN